VTLNVTFPPFPCAGIPHFGATLGGRDIGPAALSRALLLRQREFRPDVGDLEAIARPQRAGLPEATSLPLTRGGETPSAGNPKPVPGETNCRNLGPGATNQ